jgi:hypothetical protein
LRAGAFEAAAAAARRGDNASRYAGPRQMHAMSSIIDHMGYCQPHFVELSGTEVPSERVEVT